MYVAPAPAPVARFHRVPALMRPVCDKRVSNVTVASAQGLSQEVIQKHEKFSGVEPMQLAGAINDLLSKVSPPPPPLHPPAAPATLAEPASVMALIVVCAETAQRHAARLAARLQGDPRGPGPQVRLNFSGRVSLSLLSAPRPLGALRGPALLGLLSLIIVHGPW